MKAFAQLIDALDSSNKTTLKIEAIEQFITDADDTDKLWFLALFTGKRPKRIINTTFLKLWAQELTETPEWLFQEAYSAVGDLSETIALILPPATQYVEKSLSHWMDDIANKKDESEEEKKSFILQSWMSLPPIERFIFNKLLGGSFRIGVSSKTLINAIAKFYKLDPTAVAHSIMGNWQINEVNFDDLVKGKYAKTELSKPYPFCLAYPLEKEISDEDLIKYWQVEYKWDGIRAQIIKRNNEVFIWSRGEELVNAQFPEIVEAIFKIDRNFVIDGELLAFKNEEVLNFNELQKRLNRKNLTPKMLDEIPVVLFSYDILELEGEDLRSKGMQERRKHLELLLKDHVGNKIYLSEIIKFNSWDELKLIREKARTINSEGLMLKHKFSNYHAGRKKGDWWKWKIDPLTIDAVLIYAQKGSGRRSGYYTDYTFAVKQDDKLVTIAKAYSGLTDKEIQEVSRFVTKNSIEKFGPVRTVKAELVFEIAFEGIGFSNRHKSGVALRFPRILRWRKDKTVADIDHIEEIKKMIN